MAKRICIIEHFIIPNLKTKKFGKLLQWENEDDGIFLLRWSHKSAGKWKEEKFNVFTAWDQIKGRNKGNEFNYYTNSKGRFRSALNRLRKKITFLKTSKKSKYRRYQLKKYKKNEDCNLQDESINFQDKDQFSPQSLSSFSSSFSSENEINNKYGDQLSPQSLSSFSSSFNSENEISNKYEEIYSDKLNNFDTYYSNFSQNDLYLLHCDGILFEDEYKKNLYENKEISDVLAESNYMNLGNLEELQIPENSGLINSFANFKIDFETIAIDQVQ